MKKIRAANSEGRFYLRRKKDKDWNGGTGKKERRMLKVWAQEWGEYEHYMKGIIEDREGLMGVGIASKEDILP